MRISSIDIGSNAVRQLIVEIHPETGSWVVLKKYRESIRIGTDVFKSGEVSKATLIRLIGCLKNMSSLAKAFKADQSLAYGTSALRDAKNKKFILSAAKKNSSLQIKIISGQEEAKLIRLAVQKSLPQLSQNYLLIDIGGGSVELTQMNHSKVIYSKSFKWGMVRTLLETEAKKVSYEKLIESRIKNLAQLMPVKTQFNIAVGSGGNLDALAKLKIQVLKKTPNTGLFSYI